MVLMILCVPLVPAEVHVAPGALYLLQMDGGTCPQFVDQVLYSNNLGLSEVRRCIALQVPGREVVE